MPADAKDKMPQWGLSALSWILSFYFLAGFISNAGFPPPRTLFSGDVIFVSLWLLFLFLPFYSKIKIVGVLELEREVARAKEELRDFKTEVRNSIAVLSTNVNTMSNQVTVNIPNLRELHEARQEVENKVTPEQRQEAVKERQQWPVSQQGDINLALANTRIEIERQLRLILGKRTGGAENEGKIQFMSVGRLFDLFLQQNEQYYFLSQPFRYVIQICNAAIHAQHVPDAQANEALALGSQIIAVLKLASRKAN